jgi:hypothetical protein
LRWTDLDARQAIVHGLIPGLIFLAHQRQLRFDKRDKAIDECLEKKLVTERHVRDLLMSFITGDPKLVPEPLLVLMNTFVDKDQKVKVQWIPVHMMAVLKRFQQVRDLTDTGIVRGIVEQLWLFAHAKEGSGDAWEHLFVAVLLIRAATWQFDNAMLELYGFVKCSVSFNEPFGQTKSFEMYRTVDKFVGSIRAPETFPHVAVYLPTNASFEEVDVIVATWDKARSRRLYGYQLKEGKQLPSKPSNTTFLQSWVIRGEAAQESQQIRNWRVASTDEISAFFGTSGMFWTPQAWKELQSRMKEKN